MLRTSLLTVACALSSVSGTPSCVLNPGYSHIKEGPSPAYEKVWMWQHPFANFATPEADVPTPSVCYGRTTGDAETPAACDTKCEAMNQVTGIGNAKVMCANDGNRAKILASNAVIQQMQDGQLIGGDRYMFFWTSIIKSGSSWSDPGCNPSSVNNPDAAWGSGTAGNLPNPNQLPWETETDSAGATPVDAAIWVVGNNLADNYGDTPYLAGVTAAAPNPSDVFCFCQWDPYDPDAAPACASTTHKCCAGTNPTMVQADAIGSNCVGTAGYANSKEVSKAYDNAVAAAVGLGTGLLVAVIVVPIVGLVLLIVCIVCCCKHCGGGKPSA